MDDLTDPPKIVNGPAPEFEDDRLPFRFWDKALHLDSGCWSWSDLANRDGYGIFSIAGKRKLAHRVAYEALVAPIPLGLTLDHLCRVRRCVNPAHLEPVTQAENLRRARAARATGKASQ